MESLLYETAFTVATKLRGGIITSSLVHTPIVNKANLNAEVPFDTATTCLAPVYSEINSSNFVTHSPELLTQPVSIQSLTYLLAFESAKEGYVYISLWNYFQINS